MPHLHFCSTCRAASVTIFGWNLVFAQKQRWPSPCNESHLWITSRQNTRVASIIMTALGANHSPMTKNEAIRLQNCIFDAAGREVQKVNSKLWYSLVVPDFWMHELGVIHQKDDFLPLIKRLHDSGQRFRWSLADPQVKIAHNLFTIHRTNVGGVSKDGGPYEPTCWLESAMWRRTQDGWQVCYMSSTRKWGYEKGRITAKVGNVGDVTSLRLPSRPTRGPYCCTHRSLIYRDHNDLFLFFTLACNLHSNREDSR